MKHLLTKGIILHRINYGEADRILTILTPDHGKIRAMARGVRKERSKLAGGIELFSTANITFIAGKRDISTLVSTRLDENFGNIVQDINRTMLGYDLLKLIDKATQDECEPEFYELLKTALASLNEPNIPVAIIKNWFHMRLLQQLGHEPNLKTDTAGQILEPGKAYSFDYNHMAFVTHPSGKYNERHIKFMRVLLAHTPKKLATIEGGDELAQQLESLIKTMISHAIH